MRMATTCVLVRRLRRPCFISPKTEDCLFIFILRREKNAVKVRASWRRAVKV